MAEGTLEHSLAFASMTMDCGGSICKNGATKPFEEKARVAQKLIEMIRVDPQNKPSICACENIRNGYLYVMTQHLVILKGIYGFKSPKRFLEITSRDLTSFLLQII